MWPGGGDVRRIRDNVGASICRAGIRVGSSLEIKHTTSGGTPLKSQPPHAVLTIGSTSRYLNSKVEVIY